METRPIFLLFGLLATIPAAADAYRWVDEDGVVHYSDRPQDGAERVELSEYTRDTGARLYRRTAPAASEPAASDQAPFRYERLAVASPGAEETLWNLEGVLNVSLALSPPLQTGHQVRVYFDGKPQVVNGTSFQLQEVWRGAHNLQAEVIDETGRLMIRSTPSRFYVQQSTVNLQGN